MAGIRQGVAWLIRHTGLYLLLVLAAGFYTFGWPWMADAIERADRAEARYLGLDHARARLPDLQAQAQAELARELTGLETHGLAALESRLERAGGEKAALEKARPRGGVLVQLATGGQDAVIANQRRELRLMALDRQIAGLNAAIQLAELRQQPALAKSLPQQQDEMAAALRDCRQADARLKAFESRWQWRVRRIWPGDEHQALARARDSSCGQAQEAAHRLRMAAELVQSERAARAALARAGGQIDWTAGAAARELHGEWQRARSEWRGSWREKLRLWTERWEVGRLMRLAAIWFVAILAMPWLIRALFYHVLAPLAERSGGIRLAVPGGRGADIPATPPSAPSVSIRLRAGEELLVRQGYLQSTDPGGEKRTRFLFDWRHPFSSLAAGLVLLTRLRGEGLETTISPIHDPFAEVTVLALPAGAACVLHPRALAGVAQPIGQPMRIESRWRLFSLHAWLTWQLRFLVFHGPARLVIRGGRGVRVEQAVAGRIVGQAQLVGFSAELTYAIARTETFTPYLLGRAALLKDRVERGEGVVIIEESPLSSGRGRARHGLEGALDAVLKAFGL